MDRRAELRLSVPAQAEYVASCRHTLGVMGRMQKIEPGVVYDLKLALTEACTNAIEHAYRDGEGALDIQLELTEDVIAIQVTDSGRGFTTHKFPDRPVHPNGGNGLRIIQSVSDEFFVFRGPDGHGTRVRFAKRI